MTRAALWIVLSLAGLGFILAMWLIICSLASEPGANMVLMGLPMIAFPTVLLATVAIGIVITNGASLTHWERLSAWLAAGLALVVFGFLFMLG